MKKPKIGSAAPQNPKIDLPATESTGLAAAKIFCAAWGDHRCGLPGLDLVPRPMSGAACAVLAGDVTTDIGKERWPRRLPFGLLGRRRSLPSAGRFQVGERSMRGRREFCGAS
jgi:hypothetical protein